VDHRDHDGPGDQTSDRRRLGGKPYQATGTTTDPVDRTPTRELAFSIAVRSCLALRSARRRIRQARRSASMSPR
jgi:hypothetical protein